jgi:hypothetical protein
MDDKLGRLRRLVARLEGRRDAHPWQFSLKTLFAATSIVAAYAAVLRYAGPLPVLLAIGFLVFALALLISRDPAYFAPKSFLFSVVCIQAAIILCPSVWYTDGELLGGLAWAVVIILCGFCSISLPMPRLALACVLVLLVPFVVRQLVLLERLAALEREVTAMAAYLTQYESEHSASPEDISGYAFKRPSLEDRIRYWPQSHKRDGYWIISYELHDADITAREYSAINGWYYYPD